MTAFSIPKMLPGEPFGAVLDVGGNVGEFAERAYERWPDLLLVSFEPIPQLAELNKAKARGRWTCLPIAVSDVDGQATLYVCENQHAASTMQEPGGGRAREFGVVDSWSPIHVPTRRLDACLHWVDARERLLVKIDVEGHEGRVLAGASATLDKATTVIVEVQNDPTLFLGSPPPWEVDAALRAHGLEFCGLADALKSPRGDVLQFDGVWTRSPGPRG